VIELPEPIIKELEMIGFLDGKKDQADLIKAIDEWIPKALKKYLG